LYKEAADVLATIVAGSPSRNRAGQALANATDISQSAVAEMMGALPLAMDGPRLDMRFVSS
jgi:hypothetical protein